MKPDARHRIDPVANDNPALARVAPAKRPRTDAVFSRVMIDVINARNEIENGAALAPYASLDERARMIRSMALMARRIEDLDRAGQGQKEARNA